MVPSPLSDGTAPLRRADLYFCQQCYGGACLARFSSRGSNYASCLASIIKTQYLPMDRFSTEAPALIAAYNFAKAKGLV